MRFENGIELQNVDAGLRVRQHSDSYIARKWHLTPTTIELVNTALSSGLRWMIRDGHPQAHALEPSGKGRVYIAFSPTRDQHWSVAIDSYNPNKGDYAHAVFNGKYHEQFVERGVPFDFEKRNTTAGHLVVKRDDVLATVRLMKDFDHSVLYLGRSEQTRPRIY